MEYTQFVEEMHKRIQFSLPKDETATIVKVNKNNGVLLQGIIIRKENEAVSPTIYLDYFFKEYCIGASLEELTTAFLKLYEEKRHANIPDVQFFNDYQEVKKRLAVKLVNKEKNKEMLKDMPYVEFLDLAIIFYCQIGETSFGNATVAIHWEHVKKWNVNVDILYADAMENTKRISPPTIIKMNDILQEFLEEQKTCDSTEFDFADSSQFPRLEGAPVLEFSPMLILTNERKYYGAVGILFEDVLEKFARQIGDDFYILPSSIHEVILIPQAEIWDERELRNMVKEVNATQLDMEDILADSVYYYDRVKKTIIRCI